MATIATRKTPPAQFAAGDDHHEGKWSICQLMEGIGKYSQLRSRISEMVWCR